jgi:nitrite reductase (NADH) small subunit
MSSEREARLPLRDAPAEGSVRMLDVGGHRIGLYRVDDSLYALADRCPHRGAPLCSGRVATPVEARDAALTMGKPLSIVRCPWHKWEYEISTGRCLVDERLRVRTYAVRVDGDQVVVSLDRPT